MRCCLVSCQATVGCVNVLPEDEGSTFPRNGGEFLLEYTVDCVLNVMAHAQTLDFVFRRNGRIHLHRRWSQFCWLLAAEVCASAVIMLDTPCSEVVWRVLITQSIPQFPPHFPSRASPCAITFQLDFTTSLAHSRRAWETHICYTFFCPFCESWTPVICICALEM